METNSPRRADLILTGAIALVAIFVLALVLVLGAGAQRFADSREERGDIRAARNGLIAYSQEEAEVLVAHRSYLLTGADRFRSEYENAKQRASAELARVREFNAHDEAVLAIITRIEARSDELHSALDASVPSRRETTARAAAILDTFETIENEAEAAHRTILLRSDLIRESENVARRRIDSLAGILALASLATSVLAVLALRRERQQWTLATQAAEEAHAKAAASDLAKTRFLAVASHDMRQPLHALTLYLSALERRVETAEAREIIAKMDRATQSMVGMFATLLDLARIQAGVVKPEIEDVRVQEVIERILAEHPDSVIEARPTSHAVRTDPVLLERILRNLVSNAVKHGGGKARIDVTGINGDIEIAVVDSGPGIAAEDQERIFEEFVRIEGRGEGLGVGLAIVKRIADLLHAPLDLQSAPGAGARFALRMPRASARDPAPHHAEPVALNGEPVLVVDDDPMAREAVARMLTDLGAEVRTATDEASAAAALSEGFSPRLLVMDLRIDGALSGIDIARRLRAKLLAAPHVIVVTGDTAAETLSLLRESGFPWLIKPVNPRELSEAAAARLATA